MLAVLGHIFSTAGKQQEALSVLEELERMSNQCYVSPLDMAIEYALAAIRRLNRKPTRVPLMG